MPISAQEYIALWRTLALIAGIAAGAGALVGLVGSVQAWRTMKKVQGVPHHREMTFVVFGDLTLLVGLTIAAWIQVGVSIGLVAISARYPTDLEAVLVALDGLVTGAYVGYVLQVIMINLTAPIYLVFRTLALLSEESHEQ